MGQEPDGEDTGEQETEAHWYETAWGEIDERFRGTARQGETGDTTQTGESSEVIA